MEILKIVIPKWNIAEITGYDPLTTFWQDFSMADKFGNEAIADTYRKVKAEWKDNYKHWTEPVSYTHLEVYKRQAMR